MRKFVHAAAASLAVLLGAVSVAQAEAPPRQYFGYQSDSALDGSEIFGPIRAHGADRSATLAAIAAFAQAGSTASVTSLINAQVPAIVTAQAPAVINASFPALFAASLAALPGFNQPATGSFWGAAAHIDRFADRVFMGPAVNESGLCQLCGGAHDWFEGIAWAGTSYNGGPPVYSDGPFAQVYILGDPNSATATVAAPAPALVVGAETLNGVDGSTVRGMDLTVINNAVSGQNPGAWALYIEGHHVGSSTVTTYGIELEMRHSGGIPTHWDPYYTTPGAAGTVGIDLGCGAGLPAAGQKDCTVAMYIGATPMPWSTGIIFFPGSVDHTGPGTTIPAIALPIDYSVQWYTGPQTLGATLTGAADGGLVVGGSHLSLATGYLAFGVLPLGTPAYHACFTAAGVLVTCP